MHYRCKIIPVILCSVYSSCLSPGQVFEELMRIGGVYKQVEEEEEDEAVLA